MAPEATLPSFLGRCLIGSPVSRIREIQLSFTPLDLLQELLMSAHQAHKFPLEDPVKNYIRALIYYPPVIVALKISTTAISKETP